VWHSLFFSNTHLNINNFLYSLTFYLFTIFSPNSRFSLFTLQQNNFVTIFTVINLHRRRFPWPIFTVDDLHRQRSSLKGSLPLPETQLQSNSQSLLLDSQLQSQLPHSKRNSSTRFQNRISIHNCNCSSFVQHRNSSIHNRISSVR
jgi:hypothetical protein